MTRESTVITSGSEHQFATFFVDGMFFGVSVLQVQEVLRYQEMTRVPLAHEAVEGLINLRGQIVTAIDMRRRLKVSPRKPDPKPLNIIVRSDEGVVSLLVDEIGDVIEVDPGSFELPPSNMSDAQQALVDGVYKLDAQLLLILNTERTLKTQGDV